MNIVKNRNIFFTVTALLVCTAVFLMYRPGLSFGIDFTGGALLEVEYVGETPAKEMLEERIETLPIGQVSVRPTGDSWYIIRTKDLSEAERIALSDVLTLDDTYTYTEKRFTSIGPVIGTELREKAIFALVAVLGAIILFIAFAFRKVSKPVSSWKYGLIAIIALAHDVIIPLGAFAVYGFYTGAEIDVLFVMAILAILGYSVNDTIVVFDRVRENLSHNKEYNVREPFADTVGKSLSQTLARSINTSLTTLFVLLTLFFVGGETTQHFAFTLLVGVIAGSYSSIFLASPLLVWWEGRQKKATK